MDALSETMFIKRVSIVFLLIIFCCLKASASLYPDSILFRGYAEQYNFRSTLETNGRKTEQTKRYIDSLVKWAENKDDIMLKYGLMITSSEFSLKAKGADTAIEEKKLKALIPELDNNRLYELKAEALQVLAIYYADMERYPESFEYHINAYKIYNKYSLKEFPRKPNFLLDFGGRYYKFRDFNTAGNYILEGYRANPEKENDYIFTMLNTLSLCYLFTDNLDSAGYYLNRGLYLAKKKQDKTWISIMSGNLGALYFKKHEYDKALQAFEVEISGLGKNKRPSMNVANTYSVMAEIYIAKGDKTKALDYAVQAYNILKNAENYTKKYELNSRIYSGLAKAYAAVGNHELAYKFLDSSIIAKDSVDKKKNAQILAGIRHKISANERLIEQEKYDREKQNNKLLRNILLAAIVLIIIIAILVYNRQKLKHSFSQKQLEAQKQHIESELDIATKQLDSLVGSISEKNDLIEKFTSELDRLREYLSDEKLFKADEALMHLQKATIITDGEWEHFVQMFDKVNAGFIKRLDQKLKGLSPIESKFIILSKLKLSTKEVASALGISAESVRLNRKRLYSKLGLNEGEHSLQALIDSI